MVVQRGDDEIEAPLIEFVAPLLAPLAGEIAVLSVECRGDIEQMLLGVEAIDNLDGIRHMLAGDVPYPGSTVTKDNPPRDAEEVAPLHLAQDPLGKGRRLLVGITGGDGFNGAVVGDRPGIAGRLAFPVAAVG